MLQEAERSERCYTREEVDTHILVLSGALKHAVKEHLIPFNPCDNCKVPKKEKREMKVLIVQFTKEHELEKGNTLIILGDAGINFRSEKGDRPKSYLLPLSQLLEISSCPGSPPFRSRPSTIRWRDEGRWSVPGRTFHRSPGFGQPPNTARFCCAGAPSSLSFLPQHTVDLLIMEHEKHPDNPLMFPSPRTNSYWSPEAVIPSRTTRTKSLAGPLNQQVQRLFLYLDISGPKQ